MIAAIIYSSFFTTFTWGLRSLDLPHFHCVDGTRSDIRHVCLGKCLGNQSDVQLLCQNVFLTTFKCSPTRYIPLHFVCDGINNCEDNFDELFNFCQFKVYKNEASILMKSVLQINSQNCGTAPSIVPLILNGWKAERQEAPWHASLYKREKEEWSYFCSGTILTEKAVLTAAHCLWEYAPNKLKVAAGKLYRSFKNQDEYTQISQVKSIVLHPFYHGSAAFYASDIAVLFVETPFSFSLFVIPICIDWAFRDFAPNANKTVIGKVMGMGVTENNTLSEELRVARLKVLPNYQCLSTESPDFQIYIGITSFCAGWNNGTGVCSGDSGAGLVIFNTEHNKWFLEGIVSISPKRPDAFLCDPNFYAVFTKVGMYTNWLRKILESM